MLSGRRYRADFPPGQIASWGNATVGRSWCLPDEAGAFLGSHVYEIAGTIKHKSGRTLCLIWVNVTRKLEKTVTACMFDSGTRRPGPLVHVPCVIPLQVELLVPYLTVHGMCDARYQIEPQ